MTLRYSCWTFISLALLLAGLGVYSIGGMKVVPLLSAADLGIHEFSHLVAIPFGETAHFLAGSIGQVLLPLLLSAAALYQRQYPAAVFCLGWAGLSAIGVAIYVADAQAQALPLLGGGTHDWAWILGHYGALERARDLADRIRIGAGVLVSVAVLWALYLSHVRPTPGGRGEREPEWESPYK